jgi:CubicO group peptidase (beta-lactamase class C family)
MIDDNLLDEISDQKFRTICEEVIDEMNRLPIPGAVVGVWYEGQEQIAPLGLTNIEHPLPVTADTLFQIGSITKTYLATAVMRLVERGQLVLDQPVHIYLPDLKLADETAAANSWADATMRHLLTHTGGWVGDYFNDFGLGDEALARMVDQVAGLAQLTPLGQVWSYNNAGFYLAGRVLEVVTGQTFEQAMQQLVLDPLGLTNSYFFAHDLITHRFAVGHKVVQGQPKVARPWAIGRAAHPAGGIVSSMKDLLAHGRFHLGDGTTIDGQRLLSSDTLRLMQTPLLPATGSDMTGLAWRVTDVNGTRLIGHGGATNGQKALLRLVPDAQFAVAVLTNSDDGSILSQQIVNLATEQYLGLSLPAAAPLTLPAEQLAPYVGRYESAMTIYELAPADGELILHTTPKGGFPTPDAPPPEPPPPLRAALYDEDRLIVLEEPMKDARGEFLRDENGRITWLRLGGRLQARQ